MEETAKGRGDKAITHGFGGRIQQEMAKELYHLQKVGEGKERVNYSHKTEIEEEEREGECLEEGITLEERRRGGEREE